MRRHLAVLLCLLVSLSVQANDPPPSKPIKPAAGKEEASAKEESKSAKESKPGKESKEAKEAAAARAKEALAADELAARIADRLAVIRKEKEELARASTRGRAPASVVRVPAVKKAEAAKAEPKATHGNNAAHWSYEGEGGPVNWSKLTPENARCESGERQSPIDIRDGIRVDLDPIAFDYKPARFNVIDNGNTIQVNIGAGNYINVLGHNYELVQFHFHRPSEERVNGRNFEMVAHLVHKDADGKLAVVAVLIERGRAHNLIQTVWNNLPLEKNEAVQALSTMDLTQILPVKRDYYTYMGSLTTPPCSEGVLWLVLKEPIEMSSDQLAIFARLYPMNARPIQRTGGRLIKESN